ncbi:4-hydroxy-3-methylbut-2-enyl diphosphate reductase [Alicyclobacillus tolerans]|uniref:Small subunit ribosomal protein S1 n=1 Tax=Alicyclobacillus tolerans TaxID=90970 RepID=A0A1M6WRC6_9BACL|nr:4-hydroxy-3-methylbut-2-enyl diphosphate reductase [Alicyclobacillus montanus]SHK96287.1 hypothetical protein SAMN05443507_12917 [Alicyclobacillus montanus]
MENVRVVYVNTFADGSRSSEPLALTETDFRMAVPNWKRAKTVVQVYLLGMEKVEVDGVQRTFFIGDVGAGKVMMPIEPKYSGLEAGQDPFDLIGRWVCGMVQDFDIKDAGNMTMLINRTQGLAILRRLNAERVRQVGNKATGIIRAIRKGSYLLDVGGYLGVMPKSWYDWIEENRQNGQIGEEFSVRIMRSRNQDRILVSRCHLMENPYQTNLKLGRGTVVRVKTKYFRERVIMAEVHPGCMIRVNPLGLRTPPKLGEGITVQILGEDQQGYYGIPVLLKEEA